MSAWLVVLCVAGCVTAKTRRDTYLAAYMESHGPSSLPPGEVHPSGDYGAPDTGYGAPATATGYNYGPPAREPHAAHENPLDPVHAKMILLFKVLLKLLIFKLIVKFIAIICVLFFLPKLSGLGLAKDDVRRMTDREKDEEDRLQVTQLVVDAISGTPVVCRSEDSPLCRLRRAVEGVDRYNSLPRLFGIYWKEEEEKVRHKTTLRRQNT